MKWEVHRSSLESTVQKQPADIGFAEIKMPEAIAMELRRTMPSRIRHHTEYLSTSWTKMLAQRCFHPRTDNLRLKVFLFLKNPTLNQPQLALMSTISTLCPLIFKINAQKRADNFGTFQGYHEISHHLLGENMLYTDHA